MDRSPPLSTISDQISPNKKRASSDSHQIHSMFSSFPKLKTPPEGLILALDRTHAVPLLLTSLHALPARRLCLSYLLVPFPCSGFLTAMMSVVSSFPTCLDRVSTLRSGQLVTLMAPSSVLESAEAHWIHVKNIQ